jgi:hypothetical protein
MPEPTLEDVDNDDDDELIAVIFAFEIVRILMVEFPESPYPVPMPEP